MPNRKSRPVAARLAPLAAVFAIVLSAPAPASAQEAGEPTALQRFLGNMGLLQIPEDPIDYRERAPLVVPPSATLIAPRNAGDINSINPDWPVDADSRRRSVDASEQKRIDEQFYETGRTPMSHELTIRGARSGGQRQAAGTGSQETAGEELARGRETYNPTQLGFRGWGAAAKKPEKPVVFEGLPERQALTKPPSELFQPSPNAPYGVVTKGKADTKVQTLYDRTSAPEDPSRR